MTAGRLKHRRDSTAVVSAAADRNGRDLEEAVAVFVGVRPRLIKVAHRILGSAHDAEDIVQEIWMRWQRMDRTAVTHPHSLLVLMTTRQAINLIQSSRRRHESPFAASPLQATEAGDDPALRVEQREALEQALLVIMECLTPRQRAALVLRDAFDYPYGELSDLLQLSAANTRQLVSRARRRLASGRQPRVTTAANDDFVQAFLNASQAGEMAPFERLLADDLAS